MLLVPILSIRICCFRGKKNLKKKTILYARITAKHQQVWAPQTLHAAAVLVFFDFILFCELTPDSGLVLPLAWWPWFTQQVCQPRRKCWNSRRLSDRISCVVFTEKSRFPRENSRFPYIGVKCSVPANSSNSPRTISFYRCGLQTRQPYRPKFMNTSRE